ncbi:haloacid dehalogenase type II [Natrinema pallidum]|uniref:Haloacid dehalogenase n=2 Tax=Natrinema pallidum TaxID=69527 RepID=L9YYZ4_9EURY|nr:haloacid dehalogenase type II [Natrinema pallidum]ELY79334.1 haloacid dehalogenase [Natrinema pallidum DSM 3751]QCW04762.1 haloacid dehalogenase type II [Natrinema pallidum]
MAFDPDRATTVTFDSYSTLVDVDATVAALADHADIRDPDPVSRTWRERSMQYTLVANHLESYETFYEINRDALAAALAAHGIDLPADEREDILEVYHELEVFDDVRESVERLHEAGYDTYVLSNGTPEMLESMVDHAGIGDLLVDTISADELETFKPDVELYRHAAGRTGTPLDELVHVSALWFDVQGAIHAGMQGVWLDRKGTPWEPFGDEPDLIAEGLAAVADRLEG